MREHDNVSDIIQQHWARRAGAFDDDDAAHELVGDSHRAWLDLLTRLVGRAPRRVLDIGCGTGFLALRFAELGHDVTGIDLAPQMVELARRKAEEAELEIDFRVGDAAALDEPDASYDVVAARHVIWNLPDPARGMAEWLRVLRPGGRLVLVEGTWSDRNALAERYASPASRVLGWALQASAPLLARIGGPYARRLLRLRYYRIEAKLPFAGGAAAEELVALLQANGVEDIVTEPLMDAVLWGEPPQFPRYLAVGTPS